MKGARATIQFVVPIFAEMFSGFGKELPWLTQKLVDISEFVKSWWYVIGGGVIGLVFLFRRWKATTAGHLAFDRFKLKALTNRRVESRIDRLRELNKQLREEEPIPEEVVIQPVAECLPDGTVQALIS